MMELFESPGGTATPRSGDPDAAAGDAAGAVAGAAEWCERVRRPAGGRPGRTLGFVPTMGALHQGHLELVRRAVAENDVCCVSVFVNPLQFNDPSDFEHYPRDLARDAELLELEGCAMAFSGTLAGFFPGELDPGTGGLPASRLRDPGPAALGLEGEMRPGHFAGVATIVERLFSVVRPDRAYFGHKDFQQTLVVRDLASATAGPRIVVCPTSREASGLARSSRNELLTDKERERAVVLPAALRAARAAWDSGERRPGRLRDALLAALGEADITVEYAELRDPEHWTADVPDGPLERAVALIAARVGEVRLIDNARLDDPSGCPA